jgi:hypothetical protein
VTLENLLTDSPHTAIALVLWYKMGKMEGRMDMIANKLGIVMPPRPKGPRKALASMLGLALVFVAFVPAAGCALNRPYMSTTTTSTNGTALHQVTKATTLAFWPASSEVMKQRVSSGKTQSIGQEGISETAGPTTNDVQVLTNLRAILGR